MASHPRRPFRVISQSIMRAHRIHIPKYDFRVLIRPWFVVFTFLVMIALAFLGFTNFAHALPLNDKVLRFVCFGVATGVFYFIFDIEEESRRIWMWRYSPLMFTAFTCFFCGGILSEVAQSMLPYKEFQIGDVIANLLGSSLGLCIAYSIDKHHRHRKEIARLYRPVDTEYLSDPEDVDEDIAPGTQLLPLYARSNPPKGASNSKGGTRLADVWDEREEIFGVGEESDEDEDEPDVTRQGP
ncbi:hypothetical protein BDN72DRAFT_870890 [Pluteus cervinus]|uniref:Uncharacterized protein n=1 Tax=Pluteus cervinus TaxID=181527 RepID=A0ACD3ARX2_9AGAR|nr:hypothetical protein BDN72DRAFT_870890 [Pluteus cervinus]